jgi:hypothetical protein
LVALVALLFCIAREVEAFPIVSFAPVSFDVFDLVIGLLVARVAEEGAASVIEIAVETRAGADRRAGSIVAEGETARGRARTCKARGVAAAAES